VRSLACLAAPDEVEPTTLRCRPSAGRIAAAVNLRQLKEGAEPALGTRRERPDRTRKHAPAELCRCWLATTSKCVTLPAIQRTTAYRRAIAYRTAHDHPFGGCVISVRSRIDASPN